MEHVVLIKYGELTTKKGNRKFFVNVLKNNIIQMLDGIDYHLEVTYSHMLITTNQVDQVIEKLKCVFGIHNIIRIKKIKPDFELLKTEIINLLKTKKINTFKVETKRSDKQFALDSMEINRKIGGIILANTDFTVDVHHPDLLLKLEIRKEAFFVYEEETRGLGGYPVGIQGKGVLMLSGGIDSPVAAYLAMKRGIKLIPIYFDSPPHTSPQALSKVEKLVKILSQYDPDLKLKVVHFTDIQETIYKNCRHDYLITLMRRMMYRIGEEYALKLKAKCIINGESIGQVASQTLDSIAVINEVIKMPVIRPVACFDKLEIIALSEKIGTYETSILPFEDCCTIFVPKNPVIKPDLKTVIDLEQNYDVNTLLHESVQQIK